MELIEGLILGLMQGVFEWLPVSSEAVTTILMIQLFGATPTESINTAIWLHTGTMLAATLYFRKEIFELTEFALNNVTEPENFLESSEKARTIRFLTVSTFLTGLIGGGIYLLGLEKLIGNPEYLSAVTGIALVFTGVSRFYSSKDERKLGKVTDKDSVLAGLLQSLSILPGISRSGITTLGLLYREFDAESAFKLSFLMSIPAILIANIGLNLFSGFTVSWPLLAASLTSFIIGYATIDVVLKFAERAEIALICFILAAISFIPLIL